MTTETTVQRPHSNSGPPGSQFLLLGAPFSTENMGVGALAVGALSILLRADPLARIAFLDYGRESANTVVDIEGRQVSIPLINLRFSWKLFLANNVIVVLMLALLASVLPPTMRRRLVSSNRVLCRVDAADSAYAVSGGDSFSDIYGLGRFFYVVLPQLIVIFLGKPLVLLPQTVGPFKGALSRRVARAVLKRASLVFTRDAGGLAELQRLLGAEGDPQKLRFSHDMGFAIAAREPASLSAPRVQDKARYTRPLVGLNVSGLLCSDATRDKSAFGFNFDYNSLIVALIRVLIEDEAVDVLLIPHVYGRSSESDVAAIDKLMYQLATKYVDRLFSLDGGLDQNEVKFVIGQCDFFVGSRMHACIAALSQSIPAVGIAYSDKFTGVFSSVGMHSLVADPRIQTVDEIVQTIKSALRARSYIREELRNLMPTVRADVLTLLLPHARSPRSDARTGASNDD